MYRSYYLSFISIGMGLLIAACDKKQEAQQTSEKKNLTTARSSSNSRTPETLNHSRHKKTATANALEAALAIASLPERQKSLAEIAWNAIETDPELAHKAFGNLAVDSAEKLQLIQHYAIRLTEQNPDEALAWAEALGTQTEIAAAKNHIALALAETDPLRAAKLLSESGMAGRDFDVAIVQVIQRWATKSPKDAAAWVSNFPQGQAREAGIREISQKWLPQDPTAAFAWITATTDKPLRMEIARAMEGALLKSPKEQQEQMRQQASSALQEELLRQRSNALLDMGDDVPRDAASN
jgi:hypothetical protein